ncbi:Light-sensor Protein kinase [Dirofilaria immitis]
MASDQIRTTSDFLLLLLMMLWNGSKVSQSVFLIKMSDMKYQASKKIRYNSKMNNKADENKKPSEILKLIGGYIQEKLTDEQVHEMFVIHWDKKNMSRWNIAIQSVRFTSNDLSQKDEVRIRIRKRVIQKFWRILVT